MLSRALSAVPLALLLAACCVGEERRRLHEALLPVPNEDGTLVYRIGYYAPSRQDAGLDICSPDMKQCNRVARTDQANTIAARWVGERLLAVVVTGPIVEKYVSRGRVGELQYTTNLTECFPNALFGGSSAISCSEHEIDILCSDAVFGSMYVLGEIFYDTHRGTPPPAGARRVCPVVESGSKDGDLK